jgi:hypothetical protein
MRIAIRRELEVFARWCEATPSGQIVRAAVFGAVAALAVIALIALSVLFDAAAQKVDAPPPGFPVVAGVLIALGALGSARID